MSLNNFKLKKILGYLSTFCLVSASSGVAAFYDAYPNSEGPYTVGPVSKNLAWSGEDFESYQDQQLLACSNQQTAIKHLDVTSGCLAVKYAGNWKRGFSDSNVFRVVANSEDILGNKIKYTNQRNQFRANIKHWQRSATIPAWSGLHAFARYQTSDDLYVASLRHDGYATIKVKYQGSYSTLAQTRLSNGVKTYLDAQGHLATNQWYKINFSAIGNTLTLSLDGVEILSVDNNLLSEGTIGIRTDYVATYLDDWQLMPSRSEEKPAADAFNEVYLDKCITIIPWNANSAFSGGDYVQFNNKKYQANWWTQGQNPSNHAGEWQAWSEVGDCHSA